MLKMLILVCAIGVAPADCRPQTALDIIRGPDIAGPAMCGLHGQAHLAETALADRQGEDAYLKVVCARPGALAALFGEPAFPSKTSVSAASPR